MASKSRQDARGRLEQKKRSLLFGLLAGALLGLVVAGLMIWYFLPRAGDFKVLASAPEVRIPATAIVTPARPATPATTATPAGQSAQPSPDHPPAIPAPANPEYTFYEILPGNQSPKPNTPKPKPTAGQRMAWWLQVAALKSEADANALRARLLLIELPAVIQPTNLDGGTMFRIRVGPFNDEATMQAAREKLRVNNFETKLLKEAVTP